MAEVVGRAPSGQALAVPATPAGAVDGPSGFDPSRDTSEVYDSEFWRNMSEAARQRALDYHPCEFGVHLCGADHDEQFFYTATQFPVRNGAEAQALFDAMRAECASEDGHDFIADLMIDGGILDDFPVRRQMVNRMAAIATETRQGGDAQQGSVEDEGAGLAEALPKEHHP